jgi:hypothetical protein
MSELYSGLLLIHLKLGMYAGPAACKPLQRERCHAVFVKMDLDQSGSLDKDEFRQVMMVLFGNVIFRVLVQWAMTLVFVPLVAKNILSGIYQGTERVFEIVTNLDEHSRVADVIEDSIKFSNEVFLNRLPSWMLLAFVGFGDWLDMVPDSVWSALPLTIISTTLGIVVVPWIIFKIDDFFQWIADHSTASNPEVKC